MGRHIDTLTPQELVTSLKPFWASIVIYNLGLFLCKFSILLQYLRIFPYRLFRILNFSLMTFIFAWSCWTVFSAIFSCRPVEYFWNKSIPGGKCLSQWAVWFANAGVNIVTDVLVATLPLPFLNQLQLPKRQRIALMIVFALGGFTCIISILRLQSLLVFLQTTDISWHNPLAAIWSSLEVNIGIVCSCLPTLKTMVSRWFPRAFSSGYLHGSDNSHERRENRRGEGESSGSSNKPTDKFSFDALGRAPGVEHATQKTTVRSEPCERRGRNDPGCWGRGGDDSLEDIEFGTLTDRSRNGNQRSARELEEQNGIQVVTVVEQEVEKGYGGSSRGGGGDARSDTGSERELVGRGTRYT